MHFGAAAVAGNAAATLTGRLFFKKKERKKIEISPDLEILTQNLNIRKKLKKKKSLV